MTPISPRLSDGIRSASKSLSISSSWHRLKSTSGNSRFRLEEFVSPPNQRLCSASDSRSEEHTSELQSRLPLVCRLPPEITKSTNELEERGKKLTGAQHIARLGNWG